jgi:hypothetical protein
LPRCRVVLLPAARRRRAGMGWLFSKEIH